MHLASLRAPDVDDVGFAIAIGVDEMQMSENFADGNFVGSDTVSSSSSSSSSSSNSCGALRPNHMNRVSGHVKVAQVLVQAGAIADATDVQKRSPLHYAALKGNTALVAVLCKWGRASLELTDDGGNTALMLAVKAGMLHTARALVALGASVEHRSNRQDGEMTPLHQACLNGDAKMVEMLLNIGNADVSQNNRQGMTVLHYVCKAMSGQYLTPVGVDSDHAMERNVRVQHSSDLLRMLLIHGADPTDSTLTGFTPLHALCGSMEDAISKPNTKHFHMLKESGYVLNDVCTPDFERVRLVVPPNPPDFSSRAGSVSRRTTADVLHDELQESPLGRVLFLLYESGIDFDGVDASGCTALAWAAAALNTYHEAADNSSSRSAEKGSKSVRTASSRAESETIRVYKRATEIFKAMVLLAKYISSAENTSTLDAVTADTAAALGFTAEEKNTDRP